VHVKAKLPSITDERNMSWAELVLSSVYTHVLHQPNANISWTAKILIF
jgi:hypothetical protein